MSHDSIEVNFVTHESETKKIPPRKRVFDADEAKKNPSRLPDISEPKAKRWKAGSSAGGFGGSESLIRHQKSSLFGKNPEIPKLNHKSVVPVSEKVFSTTNFSESGVHPFLVQSLKAHYNIEHMTEIQLKAIPIALQGRDILVKSQTGSGKTLTYVTPILTMLQAVRPKITRDHGCYALVVVPTRELALQTYEWLRVLCRSFAWIVPGVFTGGEKRKSEKARIRKGINILVSTPGRLLDHVTNTMNVTLNRVRWLVLDEADRLTDMGYERDISKIVQALDAQKAEERQTILLSATLTPAVERLAGLAMKDRVYVDVADVSEESHGKLTGFALPAHLKHHYVVVPPKLRLVSLLTFLLDKTCNGSEGKIIVFMGTQDMVDFHAELFTRIYAGADGKSSGVDDEDLEDDEGLLDAIDKASKKRRPVKAYIARLHGKMEQKERTAIFSKFRDTKAGILLCTDVASRGLDLPKVHWIVQYNAPTAIEDYIHRVGRTARVGNHGNALLFLAPSECSFLEHLEDFQIKFIEMSGEDILATLLLLDAEVCPGRSMEERATKLQTTSELLLIADKQLHQKAVDAFRSFVNFYATYPRDLKRVFCNRTIHLGHYAKSFALRESPSELARFRRKQVFTGPQ
ncbi:unnamed protein product, partial [Notodromas monacha]